MDEESNFKYTNKSYMDVQEMEDLDSMEQDFVHTDELFRELVNEWLEKNGMRILLQEVRDSGRKPVYRRQNAKAILREEK